MRKKQVKDGSWKYFDDCGICSAMRKADDASQGLSLEELRSAFREQRKRKA